MNVLEGDHVSAIMPIEMPEKEARAALEDIIFRSIWKDGPVIGLVKKVDFEPLTKTPNGKHWKLIGYVTAEQL